MIPTTYEKLQEIGRGAHSTVFEGYDSRLDRSVAIKQLNQQVLNDQRLGPSFWEGARLFARLSHQHLLRVYDLDESRGWIMMELLPGALTRELQGGKIEPGRVCDVVKHLLAGLAYLHRQDLMHGEICLENLLCDAAGNTKLNASPGIRVGQELRKPHDWQRHVAPEILNPRQFGNPGKSVDLYYVGLVALELLTGPRFPQLFKGVGKNQAREQLAWVQWHAAAGETVPPVKKLVRGAPDELAGVVDRLLKKCVAERYASAEQALADLAGPAVAVSVAGAEPGGQTEDSIPAGGSRTLTVHAPPVLRRRDSPVQGNDRAGSSPRPWPRNLRQVVERLKRRGALLGITAAALMVLLLIVAGLGTTGAEVGSASFACLDGQSRQPLQATVWMNNRAAGRTNEVLRLYAGDYDVEIDVPGYQPYRATVNIDAGTHQEIDVPLTRWNPPAPPPPPPTTYEVLLTASPENPRISINAKPYPQGPVQARLPAGQYQVRVEQPGYVTIEEMISVPETVRVHFSLQPVTFHLELSVEPRDAAVHFDGRQLTGASPHRLEVKPGSHRLRIAKEGYEDIHETIEVISDDKFTRRLKRKALPPRMDTWIESDPEGARIKVNGQDLPTVTPARLSLLPGPQKVRLTKQGYRPIDAEILVQHDNRSFFWYLDEGLPEVP